MAITATQRTDLIKATVALFNAAPGSVYLSNFVPFAGNVQGLIEELVKDPAFTAIYPAYQTSAEFAGKFIDTLVGSVVVDATKLANAKAWYAARLDAGETRAAIAYEIFNDLNNTPTTDTTWGAVAQQFQKKAAVAEYYSVEKAGNATGLETLQSVVSSVTSTTDVSTPAALDAVLAGSSAGTNVGQTFALTTSVDSLTGTAGNDTFNANLVAGFTGVADVETLNALDVVKGGAGTDTLNYYTDNGEDLPGATLDSIEVLNIVSGDDATADVSGANVVGLTTINAKATADVVNIDTKSNVTSVNVTGTATTVNIDDAGTAASPDKLASVSVTGATGLTTIGTALGNTVDTLTSLSLTKANGGATVNSAAGPRTLTLNLNEVTAGTVTDATATTLNIKAAGVKSGNFTVTAGAATAVTIDADEAIGYTTNGVVTPGATLNVGAAETITVTGDSAVNIAGGTFTALKTVDASANTGGVKSAAALGDAVTFTGGTGADSITVSAGNTKTINLGAGDDTVKVTAAALGTGGTIEGGEGTDTLVLTAADAATLSANANFDARISGFEKVSIERAETAVTVDMSGLDDVDYVISAGSQNSTVVGSETAQVTFGALAAGQTVTVNGVSHTALTAEAAAVVAAAFANLEGADTSFDSGANSGATVLYTAEGAGNVDDITYSVAGTTAPTAPTPATTQGSAGVTETATFTFTDVPAGQTVSIAGRVITAGGSGATAADIATAFITGLTTGNASVTALAAPAPLLGYTVLAGTGLANAVFTSTSANTNVAPLTNAGTAIVAAPVYVQGEAVQTEFADVTFTSLSAGQSITINGLTVTANGGTATAQNVEDAFSTSATADNAIVSGAYNAAWTAAQLVNGTSTRFTSATASSNVGDLTVTTAGVAAPTAPAVVTTQGAAGALAITKMANNGTFELTNTVFGASSIAMKDATGAADVLNIKLNGAADIDNTAATTVSGVETINITTTDSNATYDTMTSAGTLRLNAADATKITLSGNHGLDLNTGSTLTKLVELDASGVVATGNTAANLTAAQIAANVATAGAVTFSSVVANKAVTIKGGNGDDVFSTASVNDATFLATGVTASTIDGGAGNDTITGSAGKDVINGGEGKDTINSSAEVDTITLGAGNDKYVLNNAAHSVLAKSDTITDFSANTYGFGTSGAANNLGANLGDATKVTGDVIDLSISGLTTIDVQVVTSAADALTFLNNNSTNTSNIGVALDSTSGKLYIDLDDNGTADSVITLTGVTTLTEAAFLI